MSILYRKIKILFVYGYGGSPESTFCRLIREALPADQYEVVCVSYPQEDASKAREYLMQVIQEQAIDMVIGTSLGGFLALSLPISLPRVVINPCMIPSIELPKLQPRANHPEDVAPSAALIDSYAPFEAGVREGMYGDVKSVTGLFAQEDELLGTQYMEMFGEHYGQVLPMPGGHHGNRDAIPTIVRTITCVGDE